MKIFDWLVLGAVGLVVKKAFVGAAEEKAQYEREYREHEEERQKQETELNRQNDINEKRKNTPCRFEDGITYEEFTEIAHKVGKRIRRIKKVTISGAIIYCTAESQTGYSDWNFIVDFNDWGHLSGTYWKYTENSSSNIPKHFGDHPYISPPDVSHSKRKIFFSFIISRYARSLRSKRMCKAIK